MKCSYCLRETHERTVCPWERMDKLRPEYQKALSDCERDNDAMRYGKKYNEATLRSGRDRG